jgi:hypothetical protein
MEPPGGVGGVCCCRVMDQSAGDSLAMERLAFTVETNVTCEPVRLLEEARRNIKQVIWEAR